jgi:hypothetical protein
VALFTLSPPARSWMVSAAVTAAHQLHLFAALDHPRSTADLASALRLPSGRLRALVDVLASVGAIARVPDPSFADEPRFVRGQPAPPIALPPQGWGLMAEVMRRDRPLGADEELERFHAHLRSAGAASARALAERLAALPSATAGLVDLGGGAGAYTEAFLAELPAARATLVDRAPVVALARPHLGERSTLVSGDLFDPSTAIGEPHGVALLANVLHLYGPAACAQLLARAVAAVVAPDGWVVVQDLWVEPDRSGPLDSLLFALNMALYTDAGDVHDGARIAGWLAAAGLVDVSVERLGDELIVCGKRA